MREEFGYSYDTENYKRFLRIKKQTMEKKANNALNHLSIRLSHLSIRQIHIHNTNQRFPRQSLPPLAICLLPRSFLLHLLASPQRRSNIISIHQELTFTSFSYSYKHIPHKPSTNNKIPMQLAKSHWWCTIVRITVAHPAAVQD